MNKHWGSPEINKEAEHGGGCVTVRTHRGDATIKHHWNTRRRRDASSSFWQHWRHTSHADRLLFKPLTRTNEDDIAKKRTKPASLSSTPSQRKSEGCVRCVYCLTGTVGNLFRPPHDGGRGDSSEETSRRTRTQTGQSVLEEEQRMKAASVLTEPSRDLERGASIIQQLWIMGQRAEALARIRGLCVCVCCAQSCGKSSRSVVVLEELERDCRFSSAHFLKHQHISSLFMCLSSSGRHLLLTHCTRTHHLNIFEPVTSQLQLIYTLICR